MDDIEPPADLPQHFARPANEQEAAWSELWDQGRTPWDRGIPSPALVDLLAARNDLFNPVNSDGSRKKAFVPGCGSGYDPVLLALHGYDAYGLDVSEKAIATAKQYAESQLRTPSEGNFPLSGQKPSVSPGKVEFICGDFFSKDWGEHKFDLIYDYTFLCAILPAKRRDWTKRMSELLKPGGLLVCLEFPLWRDPRDPGPPWGLRGVYWELLARGGDGSPREYGDEEPPPAENAEFKRLLRVKPERSHKIGRGMDMISVWQKV